MSHILYMQTYVYNQNSKTKSLYLDVLVGSLKRINTKCLSYRKILFLDFCSIGESSSKGWESSTDPDIFRAGINTKFSILCL